jgi:hypothetical protein
MAITDRGSARIMATDSTGAMVIGAPTITGTRQRAIAASDDGGLTLIASAKSCRSRASTDQYRPTFLKRSDGLLRISQPKFEIALGCSVHCLSAE